MASLDSTSTLAQIQAAYMDNASYAEDGSVAKALAFELACRLLILKQAKQVSHGGRGGGEEFVSTVDMLREEMAIAERWRQTDGAVAAGVPRVTFSDATYFRD